jgi:peptide/nickel transport system permease protein
VLGDPGRRLEAIEGMPPAVDRLPQGCHFADRCAHAMPQCRAEDVSLRAGTAPGHRYRCVLSPEQTAANMARQREAAQ